MLNRLPIAALALAALCATIAGARAWDDARYPDWKGQWDRIGGGMYDPSKRPGRPQDPPLTAEYQAIWEVNLADEASGGQSYNTQVHCLPGGMPRMMIAYQPLETIITPDITYIAVSFFGEFRRVYTDGRDWPATIKPTFSGYSIGRWVDADGDGRYHTLEVETRSIKAPRNFDPSGIPFHKDNQTVVKERIFLDRSDPNILRDEITTFDHALTRPWTITRSYRRIRNPTWIEDVCAENNKYVFLGKESYFLSADGTLMPTRKDQPPPDLKYFNPQ
ncbi:MAG: hypothetical protein QOI12_3157 [Alphaproteobacteria bacterium]|jgi:hypothetical protein|nr:hypothetical protein [Alphaproteobacteria bacterium]